MNIIPVTTVCPYCGKPETQHAVLGGGVEGDVDLHPGDVSICGFCGEVCVFDDDMNLRKPYLDEALNYPSSVFRVSLLVKQTLLKKKQSEQATDEKS